MHVNSAELYWYIEKVSFPATKEQIVNLADSNNATDDVMELLQQLPDEEYSSAEDVIRAAGIAD